MRWVFKKNHDKLYSIENFYKFPNEYYIIYQNYNINLKCPNCNGTGIDEDEECEKCHGTGFHFNKEMNKFLVVYGHFYNDQNQFLFFPVYNGEINEEKFGICDLDELCKLNTHLVHSCSYKRLEEQLQKLYLVINQIKKENA